MSDDSDDDDDQDDDIDNDISSLKAYGTVLTEPEILQKLPRAYQSEEVINSLLERLRGAAPRAAVLVGEPGTGKSTLVNELAHLLSQEGKGWHILQMTPTDFLHGTKYLGEWETRFTNLMNLLTQRKRAILYIQNIHEIVTVGKSSSTDNNIATSLVPYVEQGKVTILGESSEKQLQESFATTPAIRRLLVPFQLVPADESTTRAIISKVLEDYALDSDENFIDRLLELSEYSQAEIVNPGKSVGLLREVLNRRQDVNQYPTEKEILSTISQTTGVSTMLLDDDIPLDVNLAREFFEQRVIGQPEAVNAALDLVTLVKARLTDPNKPFGVMLFVGPTGVGKTEMAKSLAEFCFGDQKRLSRIDMSEFSTYDAFERLIGDYGKPGILTSVVRKQPFSIILMDEIEKAHINVFDMCLQLFDAGRLTDKQGRTADFRRSIIIMTSNVGSRVSDEPAFGFSDTGPNVPQSTDIHRALSHTFRPEFLNRIDRTVVFRPLNEDTAERIARLEVERVLKRSGVVGRKLVIDVHPDVFPLLLKEGYSRTFGARPLKRTIERMILLPLARKLASGRVPAESLIRLSAGVKQIHVDIEPSRIVPLQIEQIKPQTISLLSDLQERVLNLVNKNLPLTSRKSALLQRTSQPGFWDNREEARSISEEIHRIESIHNELESMKEKLQELSQQKISREELLFYEIRTQLLELISHQPDSIFCRDIFLKISLLNQRGEPLDGLQALLNMYQKCAQRYGFETELMADILLENPSENSLLLKIKGLGANAIFHKEAGIHELVKKYNNAEELLNSRELLKVEILPILDDDITFNPEEHTLEVTTLRTVNSRFLKKPNLILRLLHKPSLISVRVQTTGYRDENIKRFLPLLHATVHAPRQLPQDDQDETRILRKIEFGQSSRIIDLRLGKKSGRIDQILNGNLDRFLMLPENRIG